MDLTNASPLMKALFAAAALYAAYKYGPAWMKGLAIGAGGFMVANQVPVLRDGLTQRVA